MIPSINKEGVHVNDIEELVKGYGLEEDSEYIIVPFTDKEGKRYRRFILKRRFVRVIYGEGYFVDYPIQDVVTATVRNPELPLSEALFLLDQESKVEQTNSSE